MASLFGEGKFQAFDADGNPLASGKLYSYAAGTLTPLATYTTQAGNVANANPVILDSAGRASVWRGAGSYRMILKSAADVTVWDVDNIANDAGNLADTADAANGDALIGVKRVLTGSVGTTLHAWIEAQEAHSSEFGAVGDGVTDDTAALQALLGSGATLVKLKPGATYIVGYAGTQTVASTAQRYCLLIPTGVILDLNGATIKAKSASNASPVMLYSVTDSGVINGVIDCNKSNQTTPATGEIAAVYAYGCTRPRVENIKAINCRMYAGRFLGNTGGRYRGLWCADSDGDGWSFGVTGTAGELREFEAEIDDIHAESCTASYGGSFQGNPALFCTKNANTGKVVGKYSAGGIKVQDMAEDSNFGLLTFIGQTNGSANSGVKVQGNGAGLQPKRIKIAAINSTSAYGNGLYIADALSVEVGLYHGLSNGTGGTAAGSDKHDFNIDVPAGGRVIIGAIDVETPAAQFGRAFGAGYCKIGTMAGKTPTGIGFSYNGTGEFDSDDIRCNDGGTGMTYAFQATGGKGHIKSLSTDKTHSTSQSRAIVNTALYDWTIDRIRLGSTDVLEGVAQLTNTATSTSVTCGHIWTEYVGGAADNFTPIIQIVPMETTARALGAMYAVPVTGSSGTGFAIKHAAAGAGNYVAWKVIGWKTLNRPFA